MGINSIKIHLRQMITTNYFFMMAISLVFSMLGVWGKEASLDMSATQMKEMLSMGYVFPLIIFSAELSKDSIQIDKITRKIEWLLSNGLSALSLCFDYSVATWIATSLLTLPMIVVTHVMILNMSPLNLLDYYLYGLIFNAILSVRVLNIKNMNKYKSLGLHLAFLHIAAVLIEVALSHTLNMMIAGVMGRYIFALSVFIVMARTLSNEKIAGSYY